MYRKVSEELLRKITGVIVNSKSDFTFNQIAGLLEEINRCEVVRQDKEEGIGDESKAG